MSSKAMKEKFDQFYAPLDEDDLEEQKEAPCDYGADTECVEPSLRDMGCCFECWLFQEMDEMNENRKDEAEKP